MSWVTDNLENSLDTWNSKLGEIWQLITQSPTEFKGGGIWKTKQGFSSFPSANNLIATFVFFFNFVRPHSALHGLTPAQVAGLNLSHIQKRDFPLVA